MCCVFARKIVCADDQSEHITHAAEGSSPLSVEKQLILHFHINEQIC